MADLANEVRLLREQIGELCRILAPSGYPYDPSIPDGFRTPLEGDQD